MGSEVGRGASKKNQGCRRTSQLGPFKTPFPHPPFWMFPSSRGSTTPTSLPSFHCQVLPSVPGWRATLTPAGDGCPPGPWKEASTSLRGCHPVSEHSDTHDLQPGSMAGWRGMKTPRVKKPIPRGRTFMLKVSDKVRTRFGIYDPLQIQRNGAHGGTQGAVTGQLGS